MFKAWDKEYEIMYDVEFIDFRIRYAKLFKIVPMMGKMITKVEGRSFDKIILLQETGLSDLTGRKISDRDILLNSDGKYGFVVIEEGHTYGVFEGNDRESKFLLTKKKIIDLEIYCVGNVFEHPELLEKEQVSETQNSEMEMLDVEPIIINTESDDELTNDFIQNEIYRQVNMNEIESDAKMNGLEIKTIEVEENK